MPEKGKNGLTPKKEAKKVIIILLVIKKDVSLHPQSRESCPDGGIGRRAGLKHQWIHFHPGSTPGLGTRKRSCSFYSSFFV